MAHRALITLEPYQEHWQALFNAEKALLESALPPHLYIEHIGSTAVVGLTAKPIIDIMLGATSLQEIGRYIPGLEHLGYEYLAYNEVDIPERRFLAKPITRPRHFHLHAVVKGDSFWNEHIAFRDILRTNHCIAEQYAVLKIKLAQTFIDNREAYTTAKGEFINQVLKTFS